MYLNHPKVNRTQIQTLINTLKEKHDTQNLNRMKTEDLIKIKNLMEEDFSQRLVKQTSQEFVYDKRQEFKPTVASDWDIEEDVTDF